MLVQLADVLLGQHIGCPDGAWSPGVGKDEEIRFFKDTYRSDIIHMDIGLTIAGVKVDTSVGAVSANGEKGWQIYMGEEELCVVDLENATTLATFREKGFGRVEQLAKKAVLESK